MQCERVDARVFVFYLWILTLVSLEEELLAEPDVLLKVGGKPENELLPRVRVIGVHHDPAALLEVWRGGEGGGGRGRGASHREGGERLMRRDASRSLRHRHETPRRGRRTNTLLPRHRRGGAGQSAHSVSQDAHVV